MLLLHAVSDGVIALSLLLIPAALLYLYGRRKDTNPRERALITLFILFIAAVGLAHLASFIGLWTPLSGLEGVLKAAAALLALTTAIVIWRLAPHLLRLPSRDRLQAEVAAHLRTFDELKSARHQLEERVDARTKELAEAKQRFEIALRGSPISVFTQDKDLRFTWVHNAPQGLTAEMLLGKTDAEALPV
ncbi:MAG TPA: histidine kinase, partial [Methyloceanibacter sp.]